MNNIFILLSIKTRIETHNASCNVIFRKRFLSYYPLKQGLKHSYIYTILLKYKIFILLSIKTRIETLSKILIQFSLSSFLSYYPLKQGLKPLYKNILESRKPVFLSYYPLKQGLKLWFLFHNNVVTHSFLSYYPLKQGLKLLSSALLISIFSIFILLSIKTRIETADFLNHPGFLGKIFILLSIKTRIETSRL